jgi:predicted ATP-dependent serine protease
LLDIGYILVVGVGVLELFEKLGVSLNPPKLLVLYGEAMVGKSTLAVMLADRLSQKLQKKPIIIYVEPIWEDPEYQNFIASTTKSKFEIVKLADWRHFNSLVAGFRDRVIVLDSLSALVTDIMSRFTAMGWDVRAITPRVNQITVTLIHFLRMVVNNSRTVGIVVAHSTSSAGVSKHRGVFEDRPAVPRRILHEVDYELMLEIGEDPKSRVLSVIANRINPFVEGVSAMFTFKDGDVDVLQSGQLRIRVV